MTDTADKRDRILAERARKLAQPHAEQTSDRSEKEFTVFAVGAETYAIDNAFVREIARAESLLPLPETANYVAGAFKLRGEIHIAFDICALAGTASAAASQGSWVVVLGRGRPEFGVVADAVRGVERFAPSDVLAPGDTRVEDKRAYIVGSTRNATTLIDGAVLLGDRRLYVGARGDHGEEELHGV